MPRNPYYDQQKAHHTEKGFRNPKGSPRRPPFTAEVAREAAHFMGEMTRTLKHYPFPDDHVIAQPQALELFNGCTAQQKLLWLGHASFLIELNGVRVLTDPYLTDYASPVPTRSTKRLVPSAIAIENLPSVDVIVISHNHYDHLDTKALKALAKRFPRAQVVVPLGLEPLIKKQGFDSIVELDWYDNVGLNTLDITAVPAIHMSRRGLLDMNQTLWCGFAIAQQNFKIYFAGDTAYGPVFKEVGQKLGPFDLGLVPIGAYQPRSLMNVVHTTPEEAIQIGEDIQAANLIGMHWGTIRLTTEPMMEPKQRFLNAESTIPRSTLRIGETVALDAASISEQSACDIPLATTPPPA